MSKLGSTKTLGSRPGNVNAGLFWSSTKTPAITTISRTLTTLDVWLSKGSFSKESFNIGASAGIKGVEIGGKFGFETEKSEISSTESAQKNERLTAVHEIPIVDINLDETTLQLSPDCLRDLERLRHHRRYSDLKKFFEEYGMFIDDHKNGMLRSSLNRHDHFPEHHTWWPSLHRSCGRQARRKLGGYANFRIQDTGRS